MSPRVPLVTLLLLLVASAVARPAEVAPPGRQWRFLAHRGVAQSFSLDGVDNDTCTAARIRPPPHGYIENTLPSMQAAFDLGAAVVELDLHRSAEGTLVVFHDATLDCRTNGHGRPEDTPLTTLRGLDLGYGYTADHGATFPLRGTGVGLMPTLDEVLDRFADRALLLHLKNDDPVDGEHLAERLRARPVEERSRRFVYGGTRSVARLEEMLPEIRTFSGRSVKKCGLGWMAGGWAGIVPSACRDTLMFVPVDDAHLLWGWPRRFVSSMEKAGSTVVIVGPRHPSGHLAGVDTPELLAQVPDEFAGLVWTNRMEAMAL